jgi:hypothetical protein
MNILMDPSRYKCDMNLDERLQLNAVGDEAVAHRMGDLHRAG